MQTPFSLRRIAALSLFIAAAACSGEPRASAAAPGQGAASSVVAEGGGFKITLAEIDKEITGPLADLRQQEYDLRRSALDRLTFDKLADKEAKDRGLTREALMQQEVEAKAAAPTDAEIESLYEQNKARLGGQTKQAVRPQIEKYLKQKNAQARMEAYRAELFAKHGLKVKLDPPRIAIEIPADAPSLGPADAKVTIVEFTDYQCPFCKRAQQTVDELLKQYQGKVRLIALDFPLDFHNRANFAARAAHCAAEQGRFWEYHRGLLVEDGDYSDQDMHKRAASLGLNGQKFGECFASTRYDKKIAESLVSAAYYGVNSTPTFFVNGRKIAGALPLQAFSSLIDEELAR